ncbi:MAG: tetratricopeptide repeat protein [Bacteroidia bacterium]|nr:tetratricopeptide repeat protein [Bacteroidia bacterium]MBP9689143.1 tetratricopeptide repeat protein [Bacteroidia bacterium]
MNKLIFITAIISLLAACNNSNNKGLKDNKAEVATSKSVAEISAQLENEPTNAELYYRRANMYYEEKLLDKSLADIEQAIVLNANQPIYLFFKGRVLYAMNKTQDAAKAYEKAIAIKPDFIEAQLKLAELYYIVKEHKKSIDLYNVILANDKLNTTALFFKGMNYKEIGDTASAVQAFQKTYEIDVNHYDAVMQLGNLYAGLNNKIALDYYITASRLRPKNPEPPFAAGVYFQQKGDYKKAVTMYQQALKADEKFYRAYYNSALINVDIRRFSDAISNLNAVIRIEPGFVDAYYMRGLCYELEKNWEDARINYQYALELEPEHALAKPALAAIKNK